jgi:hypothetical protein
MVVQGGGPALLGSIQLPDQPRRRFGILGASGGWIPLHAGVEGWVESVALAYHASAFAQRITRLSGAAAVTDLSGMESVGLVAGLTDVWWRGLDSLVAVYRGEADSEGNLLSEQGGPPPDRRRGNLPEPASIIRLAGAVLAEQDDEWTDSRRYMGPEYSPPAGKPPPEMKRMWLAMPDRQLRQLPLK